VKTSRSLLITCESDTASSSAPQSSAMLAIPMKPTCAVDMCKPLRSYVAAEFAETDGEETERNIKQFNQLRVDAVAGRSATAESRAGIDLYFSQLRFATSRFPVSESQVRLGFTWFDAFAPRSKLVLYSWKLEQAATLFNAAAMESHAGVQADRAELAGIEEASKRFLRSAQLFKMLREELQPDLALSAGLTMDLSAGGLAMLEAILCAQAQAVFYEKAVRQKMAPASVAKVAAGAAQFYAEALEASRGADLRGKLDTSWENNLAYQVQCFAGATQYWQAIKDKTDAEAKTEGFAVVVARLELAQAACARAVSVVDQSGLSPTIKSTVQQLQALVVRNLLDARHDNDMVYHEVTVAPKDLPPIAPFIPGCVRKLVAAH